MTMKVASTFHWGNCSEMYFNQHRVERIKFWNLSSGNSSNNTTVTDEQEFTIFLDAFSWALIALYIITFLVGLIGNALVCFAVWRNKNMRTVTNIFLVNLAAADLGVIIICLPPALVADVTDTWFLGGPFCNIHLFLSVSIYIHKRCTQFKHVR